MALNKGNSMYGDKPLIIVRTSTRDESKKEVSPFFCTSRKNEEGKYIRDSETFSGIAGDLISLWVENVEWEDQKSKVAKLVLSDESAGELYLMDLRFNMLNRGIFNSILSLNSTEGISIDLYTNNKGYASSIVKQNGERVSWKHDFSDLPKPEKIINPKTQQVVLTDYTDIDNFFEEGLSKLAEALNIVPKKSKKMGDSSPASSKSGSGDVEGVEDEDIPF